MATDQDLFSNGFQRCEVVAVRLGVTYEGSAGLGPFCRLRVEDTAPEHPGVYAWVVDGRVMYVGLARSLRQITQGARMGRPYNDYTYMPPSKVRQTSSPRVRVNGLINAAMTSGLKVSWWWRRLPSDEHAVRLEALLIKSWIPPWNKARPALLGPSRLSEADPLPETKR